MTRVTSDPEALFRKGLESDRIHSAYLLSGSPEPTREAALRFVRALVCEARGTSPCESCLSCRRSSHRAELPLDGAGRKGPLYRHVGDHPRLFWVQRGENDTRVRVGQVRALQSALRLRVEAHERRAAVLADAEWLNLEAQNALLHLLEEPPPRTTLVLVASSSAGLLATVRSRCQRIVFREALPGSLSDRPLSDEDRLLLERLQALGQRSIPDLLDWAEDCRGPRATAAARAERLLAMGAAWLRERVRAELVLGHSGVQRELLAFAALQACRRSLAQRNANPQMVAERAWLALRQAVEA